FDLAFRQHPCPLAGLRRQKRSGADKEEESAGGRELRGNRRGPARLRPDRIETHCAPGLLAKARPVWAAGPAGTSVFSGVGAASAATPSPTPPPFHGRGVGEGVVP